MGQKSQCLKCGAAYDPATGGRPARYCSTGCRRAGKNEIRRIDRAIEAVEEQIRWCRFGWSGRREADIPTYDAERERLEQRLRQLLDDEPERR